MRTINRFERGIPQAIFSSVFFERYHDHLVMNKGHDPKGRLGRQTAARDMEWVDSFVKSASLEFLTKVRLDWTLVGTPLLMMMMNMQRSRKRIIYDNQRTIL